MRRGFTLVELLVTLAVVSLVMVGLVGALIANQRQYFRHAEVADLQGTLRYTVAQLERSIARAGYGIDPNYALETWVLDAAGNEVPGSPRDGLGPFGSDHLVVQFRDPLFRRLVAAGAASSTSVAVQTPLGVVPERGQRMMLVCGGGADAVYLTVASATANTITWLSSARAPFNQHNRITPSSCFSTNETSLFRIERRHYFIHWMQESTSAATRPMLMLRRGVDLDGNGVVDEAPTATQTLDAEVLALDVEQLQVAYVLNRPQSCLGGAGTGCVDLRSQYGLNLGPDGNQNFVYGDQPGVREAPTLAAPWTGAGPGPNPRAPPLLSESRACSGYTRNHPAYCGYGAMRRFTGHPGNVRAVRISLAARSNQEDPALLLAPLDLQDPLENLVAAQLPPASRHRHQRLSVSVALKNMYQRKYFLPPVGANGLNVDGG